MKKYRNKRVSVDGILFDSKAEAKRYGELKILQSAGEIHGLEVHKRYSLLVAGTKVSVYEADFVYTTRDGETVVEDVKGVRTALYKLKKKMWEAMYGMNITEIAA